MPLRLLVPTCLLLRIRLHEGVVKAGVDAVRVHEAYDLIARPEGKASIVGLPGGRYVPLLLYGPPKRLSDYRVAAPYLTEAAYRLEQTRGHGLLRFWRWIGVLPGISELMPHPEIILLAADEDIYSVCVSTPEHEPALEALLHGLWYVNLS